MADAWCRNYDEAVRLMEAVPETVGEAFDVLRADNLREAQVRALLAIVDLLAEIEVSVRTS